MIARPTLPRSVTVRSGTNIALVKYWGKRDTMLNLPATGSLSLTLSELGSETRVRFSADAGTPDGGDRVLLAQGEETEGPAEPKFAGRVSSFLDLVRRAARIALPAEVITRNSVPTAAGLASSASGFAALALAASRAAGMDLTSRELSVLARRGSGSAARSIFGGFVEMGMGERADGSDAYAWPLLGPDLWDVRLVVGITETGAKAVSSGKAMEQTSATSPYYRAWLASVEPDLVEARAALTHRNLDQLGAVAERSALRMHASAMAAEPAIIYWGPATLAAIRAVQQERRAGLSAYFTMDAGPHVKVLCHARDAEEVARLLSGTRGVLRTITAAPGAGARIVEELS